MLRSYYMLRAGKRVIKTRQCSRQTRLMGSKYTKNAFAAESRPQTHFLVYLELWKRVWWPQMSSYFCQMKSKN